MHALVEFIDGSQRACLSSPDMRIPIAAALAWPEQVELDAPLDLIALGALHFAAPDDQRFPALRLARQALSEGQGAMIVYNACNEEAVAAFVAGALTFDRITDALQAGLEQARETEVGTLDAVYDIDMRARSFMREWLKPLRP